MYRLWSSNYSDILGSCLALSIILMRFLNMHFNYCRIVSLACLALISFDFPIWLCFITFGFEMLYPTFGRRAMVLKRPAAQMVRPMKRPATEAVQTMKRPAAAEDADADVPEAMDIDDEPGDSSQRLVSLQELCSDYTEIIDAILLEFPGAKDKKLKATLWEKHGVRVSRRTMTSYLDRLKNPEKFTTAMKGSITQREDEYVAMHDLSDPDLTYIAQLVQDFPDDGYRKLCSRLYAGRQIWVHHKTMQNLMIRFKGELQVMVMAMWHLSSDRNHDLHYRFGCCI